VNSVSRPARIVRLVSELKQFYGRLPEPPADAFTLFVWDVLSFQSTPQKRNAALAALKRNPSLTPDSMAKVAPKKLEESVALAGSYLEQRLRALKTGIRLFQRAPGLPAAIRGPLPEAYQALSAVPQMGGGEGSADRMLLFAGGHRVFPMDAGVGRVVRRLGYDEAPAGELPDTLDAFRRAVTYLAHHGAATCTETEPHCHVCPLRSDCPHGHPM
jgi:endonuclease III